MNYCHTKVMSLANLIDSNDVFPLTVMSTP